MAQVLKSGSRKFDLSDNWKVYHPNGKHMFTTSKRKVDWYVTRSIVKVLETEPKSVQFINEPNGMGFADHEIFGLLPRVNKCVVCGMEDDLQRHHVVPYHYRKFMPLRYKSRNHHDVVLICHKHHQEYEVIAKFYKNIIAETFEVDSIEVMNAKQINFMVANLKDNFRAIKLLDTILNRYNDIPEERVIWISNEFQKLLGINLLDLTLDEIEELYTETDKTIRIRKEGLMNVENFYHGKAVIAKLLTVEDYEKFIRGWKIHFLESMKPEFMPVGWNINFAFSREPDKRKL